VNRFAAFFREQPAAEFDRFAEGAGVERHSQNVYLFHEYTPSFRYNDYSIIPLAFQADELNKKE
jgi:hypothetical protein